MSENKKINIEEIISNAGAVHAHPWQMSLVDAVMSAAQAYSNTKKVSLGECFAAAFDLVVAAHYYGNVANKGWLYCGSPQPILLYPYTNTCPRCALRNDFHFHKSNKPRSGNIGSVTAKYLCLCYEWFFQHTKNKDVEILFGKEPVDVVLIDRKKKLCLLAEIKASPLIIFPLVGPSEKLTEESDGGRKATNSHEDITIAQIVGTEFHMLLPDEKKAKYIKLGLRKSENEEHWAAEAIVNLCNTNTFFPSYFSAWLNAYRQYSGETRTGAFWLTNSCGAPTPVPKHWPKRTNGSGFETVSDNKTSVGMDRTDDIKKGTYQVLKIGSIAKYPQPKNWYVTVGLISNIHAVQHFDDYLHSISDVMWLKAGDKNFKNVGEMPPETSIVNLFDGIISFTSCRIRDKWLRQIFPF